MARFAWKYGGAFGLACVGAAALGYRLGRRKALRFDGRVVLITGGSRGLGLILALQFAEEGAHIVICARDPDELGRARELIARRFGNPAQEVRPVVCDVSDPDQVSRMLRQCVERFGRIDILVNNAGIMQVGPIESFELSDFRDAMNVNFWGTVYTTLQSLPYLTKRTAFSQIVNVTSIGGVVAVPHILPYTCSKFAAFGFSQGLQAEIDKHGIRVLTVVPGLMRTGSFLNALFKGEREREFTWFALSSSAPLITLAAERAARRIIRACANRERWITLGVPAKVLRLLYLSFPTAMSGVFSRINRMLPSPTYPIDRNAEPGYAHRTRLSSPPLTYLGDRSARKYNEIPGAKPARRA